MELGDMTIIAGQNNTGKTYLAYTLYSFLSLCRNMDNVSIHDLYVVFRGMSRGMSEQILDNKGNLKKSNKEINRQLLKGITEYFSKKHIQLVFSAPAHQFKNSQFEIDIGVGNKFREGSITISDSSKDLNSRNILSFHLKEDDLVLSIDKFNSSNFDSLDLEIAMSYLLLDKIKNEFPKVFILSSERFGISLFYKELDLAKNRLVEELQNLEYGNKRRSRISARQEEVIRYKSARYAEAIKDNIHFTRRLPDFQEESEGLGLFNKLSDKVEDIMEAYYHAERDELKFISKEENPNSFDIPLHLASSSARGLSDLYFYFKYSDIKSGDFLMIDEPESHLSPTNQILMARLLVSCVNQGLKVLLTTHSDYIIKEINNLIMLKSNFKGKKEFIKKSKSGYTEDDYLDFNSVQAYICEDGGLTKCDKDEMGIDMPVFDDAIKKIDLDAEALYWKMQEGKR